MIKHPAAILLILTCVASADVKLHGIFTDHMVLQRDLPVPVFGTADAGETVKVTFGSTNLSTIANSEGAWSVTLKPMRGSKDPLNMTISGENEIVLRDIVIGDVWICSGQSNMEWPMRDLQRPEDIRTADFPLIRQFLVPKTTADAPRDDVSGRWVVCSPENAGAFTGVGFHFARSIHQEVGIPVGLLHSSWGGTLIEPWISKDGLMSVPEPMRECATMHFGPVEPHCLYHAMIHPLTRFPIKGAIWYQGESNAMFDPANSEEKYFHKKSALITGWRKAWNIGEFPFYWVQLANFEPPHDNPEGGDPWAQVRMAQLQGLSIANTGMAVAIDLADPGNPGDIHPKNKKDVGERLALWALAKDYGKQELVHSGPLYKAMRIEGDKIRIGFDHKGSGLMVGTKNGYEPTAKVPDGKLQRFAIAGDDRQWFWADAVTDGATVLVSSPSVPHPVAVRYAYSKNPEGCNLYNEEGLPASPFRTDSW